MASKIKREKGFIPLSTRREKAKRLFRVQEAIYTMINHMTKETKKKMNRTRDEINKFDKSKLIEFISKVESTIDYARKHLGIKVSNAELVQLLEKIERAPFLQISYMPKYFITELFTNYENIAPGFNSFPEHVFIAIDPGIHRERVDDGYEFRWLEATLFEDVCVLYNLAREQNKSFKRKTIIKKGLKTTSALCRATITMTYSFVESYLNGLAADCCRRHEKTDRGLSEKELGLLRETNSSGNKTAHVSLRDKAVKYPRIVSGKKDLQIDEDNCLELKTFLESAKVIRNSITHAAPYDLQSFQPEKEGVIYNITFDEAENIVDCAISLVRRIETEIYGNDKRLDWLYNRGSDGLFPDEAFK